MINKKILLSLLSIGLLACIASAGTWAYFQDTVVSEGNEITTATLTSQYATVQTPGTGDWTTFAGDTGNEFGPFTANDLVPDDTEYTFQYISVRNMGTTPAGVTVTVTPGTTVPEIDELTIEVGDQVIYEDGAFVNGVNPITLTLDDVGAAGADPVDASITYIYESNGNQNLEETLTIPFDMSIAVRAKHA
jgi:predicted ribosomally synthesized peptide with SipW-like signal peptide